MHELSVAESIWKVINDEMEKNGWKKLLSVKIVIGELSGVVPDALEFYLNLLKEDMHQEDVVFHFEYVPVKFQCTECGHTFTVDRPIFTCPQCGSTDVKMISGNEFYIEEMEVE